MPPRNLPAQGTSPVQPCPQCGARVLCVVTEGGKRVTLDQALPTYLIRGDERRSGLPLADRSRSYARHQCPQEASP